MATKRRYLVEWSDALYQDTPTNVWHPAEEKAYSGDDGEEALNLARSFKARGYEVRIVLL